MGENIHISECACMIGFLCGIFDKTKKLKNN